MTEPGKILIVDDHIDLADNLAEILELASYQTVVADSAEAALDRIEQGDIAAVITDFRLPGRNGAQLIAELRRRGEHMPAIVMSAFTDDVTIETASRAGALEVLPKPVDLPRLLQIVRGLGAREQMVLIVEDNHELAENLAEALGNVGVRASIAGSVAQALAARPCPRMAIVDFALPDGTGIDVAGTLKARDPRIKLLFVSGHARQLEQSLSGTLAAEERLEKPFQIQRLLDWVSRATGHGGTASNPDR